MVKLAVKSVENSKSIYESISFKVHKAFRIFKKFTWFGIFREQVKADDEIPSTELCIAFSIYIHLLIHASGLLLTLYIKPQEISLAGSITGIIKRFYKTVSIQLFSSILISMFFGTDVRYALIVHQSTLLSFPVFLFIYLLELLENDFVFGVYIASAVEKTVFSLAPTDKQEINIIKWYTFRLTVVVAHVYSFFALKTSIFTDL